ncbi:hypothetical protein BDZ97DRAFT_1758605 [Flammula alnicola]|nr:hypothetical protein BDZ97DRAFT_1758605 [Flammula alnicola]
MAPRQPVDIMLHSVGQLPKGVVSLVDVHSLLAGSPGIIHDTGTYRPRSSSFGHPLPPTTANLPPRRTAEEDQQQRLLLLDSPRRIWIGGEGTGNARGVPGRGKPTRLKEEMTAVVISSYIRVCPGRRPPSTNGCSVTKRRPPVTRCSPMSRYNEEGQQQQPPPPPPPFRYNDDGHHLPVNTLEAGAARRGRQQDDAAAAATTKLPWRVHRRRRSCGCIDVRGYIDAAGTITPYFDDGAAAGASMTTPQHRGSNDNSGCIDDDVPATV